MSQPTYDSIIIAGEPYKLSGGVKVVTWLDPGGFSFEAQRAEAMVRTGSPLYGDRRDPDKKKVTGLDQLKKTVKQVVLHSDLTRDSDKCFRVLVDRGLSTHFMIDWDGTLYQGLDVLNEAYHAGEANNDSVGVDLNNLLPNLVREPGAPAYNDDHPRFAEMSKKEFRRPVSGRMRINGGDVRSYGYTDAQYTALLALLKVLTKVLDRIQPFPPLDEKGDVIPNILEDGAGFEGFLAHWHISPSRWDPGPGFDWQRVYHGLAREHNAFPVEIEAGKNIATLLEPEKVKDYAAGYYVNNESRIEGGWYPIGRSQQWHGGVHLHVPAGRPVFAMFDGVLVAARFGARPSKLGHNNFVLLRHDVSIPTRQKDKSRTLTFFTLYMHLAPMDVATVGQDSADWVRAVHRVDAGQAAEADEAMEGGLDEEADDKEEAAEAGEDVVPPDEDEGVFDAVADADAEIDDTPYLTVGLGLAALKDGKIGLFDWQGDRPIKIASGERIGSVGQFGPPDDWQPMVHVELFADKGWKEAIDLGVHGRFFTEVEAELDSNLFVENREILGLFEQSNALARQGSLVKHRVIDPTDIEELFTMRGEYLEEKRWLRKTVTRHVSEWSDQVDWVLALSGAEDWEDRTRDFKKIIRESGIFRDALSQILPFVWLSRGVAEHAGIDVTAWDGVLYHFHPIHFLMWLTYHSSQRIQVISSGLSLAAIKKRLAREEKLKEEGKLKESDACVAAAIEVEDVDSLSAREALIDWFEKRDQGEWRVEVEEEPL